MKVEFITKFGHKIPINQEYSLIHGDISYQNEVKLLEKKVTERIPRNAIFSRFFKNLFTHSMIIDYFDSLGLSSQWTDALDIGGQHGIVSRIFKGVGKVRTADCIEIYDFSHNLDTKTMQWCLRMYKIWKLAHRLGIKNRKINRLDKAYHSLCDAYGYIPNKSSNFWNISFKSKPELDNYYVKDIFELEKKYDLITAIHVMDYFIHKKLFKKINQLLKPGGTFIFLVGYWWTPTNSTKLMGYFPFAPQRLEKDDFLKYTQEFHKEKSSDMMKAYDFFAGGLDSKPTISQYIADAQKNGLSLVDCKRCISPAFTHAQTPLTTPSLESCTDFDLNDVIRDIHCFRSDVGTEDLKTAFALGIFKKNDPKNSLPELITKLKKDGTGNFIKHN